jgi:3-carboxy-cis,cis-muconate cycloisomerase
MGEDLLLLTQIGISEVRIAGAGGSLTMPQKQNPVAAAALVALCRQVVALSALMTGAGLHRQQRDVAAWFTEWLTLPQPCLSTGKALTLAADLAQRLSPDPAAMARGIDHDAGTIRAEALTFTLATRTPRPEAEAQVKRLSAEALRTGGQLLSLAAPDRPQLCLLGGNGGLRSEACSGGFA